MHLHRLSGLTRSLRVLNARVGVRALTTSAAPLRLAAKGVRLQWRLAPFGSSSRAFASSAKRAASASDEKARLAAEKADLDDDVAFDANGTPLGANGKPMSVDGVELGDRRVLEALDKDASDDEAAAAAADAEEDALDEDDGEGVDEDAAEYSGSDVDEDSDGFEMDASADDDEDGSDLEFSDSDGSPARGVRKGASEEEMKEFEVDTIAPGPRTLKIIGTDEEVTVDTTPYKLPAAFYEHAKDTHIGFTALRYSFKLQSHDKDNLAEALDKLRIFLQYILHDVEVSNPSSLPRKIFKMTVLRSPAQDKPHKYQYEMRTWKAVFNITMPNAPAVRRWFEYDVLRHYWFQLMNTDVNVKRHEVRNYFQRDAYLQYRIDRNQQKSRARDHRIADIAKTKKLARAARLVAPKPAEAFLAANAIVEGASAALQARARRVCDALNAVGVKAFDAALVAGLKRDEASANAAKASNAAYEAAVANDAELREHMSARDAMHAAADALSDFLAEEVRKFPKRVHVKGASWTVPEEQMPRWLEFRKAQRNAMRVARRAALHAKLSAEEVRAKVKEARNAVIAAVTAADPQLKTLWDTLQASYDLREEQAKLVQERLAIINAERAHRQQLRAELRVARRNAHEEARVNRLPPSAIAAAAAQPPAPATEEVKKPKTPKPPVPMTPEQKLWRATKEKAREHAKKVYDDALKAGDLPRAAKKKMLLAYQEQKRALIAADPALVALAADGRKNLIAAINTAKAEHNAKYRPTNLPPPPPRERKPRRERRNYRSSRKEQKATATADTAAAAN